METLIIAELHALVASLRRELDTANLIIEAQDAAAIERRCVIQALQAQVDASRAAHAEAMAQLEAALANGMPRVTWPVRLLVQKN